MTKSSDWDTRRTKAEKMIHVAMDLATRRCILVEEGTQTSFTLTSTSLFTLPFISAQTTTLPRRS